jgi:hypothetical protein
MEIRAKIVFTPTAGFRCSSDSKPGSDRVLLFPIPAVRRDRIKQETMRQHLCNQLCGLRWMLFGQNYKELSFPKMEDGLHIILRGK